MLWGFECFDESEVVEEAGEVVELGGSGKGSDDESVGGWGGVAAVQPEGVGEGGEEV